MERLEVRLLNGFEVRFEEKVIDGFESQKVRALLAYLVCRNGQELSRDHLSALLWPESNEESARRNLRQALYNLRSTLDAETSGVPWIETTQRSIHMADSRRCWCDVDAFSQAIHLGRGARGVIDPSHLSGAVQLYRGDFLDGFGVKDSPVFEEWLVAERERLRDAVIDCLRDLVDHYLTVRNYDLGVQYGWRWVNLDPLSEQAHCRLMRLYALAGRRNRALAQFEECRRLLEEELGVEPMESTIRLHEAILIQDQLTARKDGSARSAYPTLVLAGRERYLSALQRSWYAVREGAPRFTLLAGPAGIGKTRVVEGWIGLLRRQQRVNLLRGRWGQNVAPDGYQPVEEALRSAVLSQRGFIRRALADLSPAWLADLGRLVPELLAQRPDLPERRAGSPATLRLRLFDAVNRLLESLCAPYEEGQASVPLILFLEDLHHAGRDTVELLAAFRARGSEMPVWILATAEGVPGEEVLGEAQGWDDVLEIGSLGAADCRALAGGLLDGEGARELAAVFEEECGGMPQAIQELVHDLGERRCLVPTADGGWARAHGEEVEGQPIEGPPLESGAEADLEQILWRRFLRLPTSARRLLTLAAVVGHRFDAELLAAVGDEHISVVHANMALWVDRHLAHQVIEPWPEVERELEAGAQAASGFHVPFEFAHERIRQVIYERLNEGRRKAIHSQVAEGLERRHRQSADSVCEALAYHYTLAESWENAVHYRQVAGKWAASLPAPHRALRHYDLAQGLLVRLAEPPERLEERRRAIEEGRRLAEECLGEAG